MTRRLVLLLALLPALPLAAACAGSGHHLLRTPAQRLHAAVAAGQAVYDPDSAGGTAYGTTAQLVHRMGPGPYGTLREWPDDLGFRPGVVYVAVDNEGRLATFWIVTPGGRVLLAEAGAPHHRVPYQTRSPAFAAEDGITVIRPGVISGDMIRSALERAGFHGITFDPGTIEPADKLRPLRAGGTEPGSPSGDRLGFLIMRTAADARKAAADAKLSLRHVSVVVGTAWIWYTWTVTSPDRSKAFRKAVAALRREARTE